MEVEKIKNKGRHNARKETSMKTKRLLCKILAVLLILMAFITIPLSVSAEEAGQSTLRIEYLDGKSPLHGAEFRVYLAATLDAHAEFVLSEEFASCDVELKNQMSNSEWEEAAKKLDEYVRKEKLTPVANGKTDKSGVLELTGLKDGLYLVQGVGTTYGQEAYHPQVFCVVLPDHDEEWNPIWTLTVTPKFTREHIPDEPTKPSEEEETTVVVEKPKETVKGTPHKIEISPGDGQGVTVGTEITYEIHWVNHADTAVGMVILDPLDPGLEFVSASHNGVYDSQNRTVSWTFYTDIIEGDVTLTVRVTDEATAKGFVENEATIHCGGVIDTVGKPVNPLVGDSGVASDKTPKTGDEAQPVLWAILMVMAAVIIIGLPLARRKKRRTEEE